MDEEDEHGAGEGPLSGRARTDLPRRRGARVVTTALAVGLAVGCVVPLHGPARAQGRDVSQQRRLTTARQEIAIRDGIKWLADKQNAGGKWGDEQHTRVADTSLALLALMADGHYVSAGRPLEFGAGGARTASVPELRGAHAEKVKQGVAYLARLAWDDRGGTKPRGYISDDKESRMHGHGFATLALATAAGNLGGSPVKDIKAWLASGSGRDPSGLPLADQVRWGLKLAIDCIEASQDRDTGGWLYEPYTQGHEGSMTVTQISALRAARDAGMEVSDAVLKKAYEYIRSSQNQTKGPNFGGFAYAKTQKGRVSYALTAASLTTLFGLGRYGLRKDDRELVRDGLRYLDRNTRAALEAPQWFYYGLFYGAQALYLADDQSRLVRDWPRIRDAVIERQTEDGYFQPITGEGRSKEYCTAIAVLTLQVPLETLPIFQRR